MTVSGVAWNSANGNLSTRAEREGSSIPRLQGRGNQRGEPWFPRASFFAARSLARVRPSIGLRRQTACTGHRTNESPPRRCRRWGSNPHAPHGAPDFESGASRAGEPMVPPEPPPSAPHGSLATRLPPEQVGLRRQTSRTGHRTRASAEGGNRTHTPLTGHRILSPARLPVPPLRPARRWYRRGTAGRGSRCGRRAPPRAASRVLPSRHTRVYREPLLPPLRSTVARRGAKMVARAVPNA